MISYVNCRKAAIMFLKLARVYGQFAAAIETCILLVLLVAHWVPVPGWASRA
jgi:hypothetical protein